MNTASVAWALALCLIAPAATAAAPSWSPPASAETLLGRGQAYTEVQAAEGGAGLIRGAVDIPAPPRVVWAVINDCKAISRMIGGVLGCRTLQGDAQRDGWDIRETITKGAFFLPDVHNVYRSDYQPFTLIRFRKAGGNLKREEGLWRFEARAGGQATRVIYENLVAVDIPAPAGLVREALRKNTAKVLANLRSESQAAAR